MNFKLVTLTAALCAAALCAACGSDDDGPTDPGPGQSACSGNVSVIDNEFVPRDITVSVGDTVTWCFNGSRIHTVTEGATLGNPNPLFDSDNRNSGAFGYRFTAAGTFPYHCVPHFNQNMRGSVTVVP